MGTNTGKSRPDLMPGTLEMLILKILTRGPRHGYGIAQQIHIASEDILRVEEGSLYPALQRMLMKGWIKGEWKQTENNRQARYYQLTAAGKKHLGLEVAEFRRLTGAIERVLEAGPA